MAHQLTYSVRQLFTVEDAARPSQPAGLADYQAQDFLIAAYQRGYKWKADGGLVENFLNTLLEAQEAGQPDYYLQYLTVKQQGGERPTLEVIDGQQRLTTLTLFFGVGRAAGWLQGPDFTSGKLRYDIRQDEQKRSLLDRYVYDTGALRELLGLETEGGAEPDWDTFLAGQPLGVDRQDMFHLFEAAQCIYRFGEQLGSDNKRQSFWNYVADNARLIVNAVAAATDSETVFQNLNDNRKELTDLDLVKGLLLTRPAREASDSFRQIMELRTAQGRQWDEMAHWFAQPAVAAVFVPPTRGNEEAAEQPGLQLLATLLVERDPEWAAYARQLATGAAQRFPLYTFLRRRLTAGTGSGKRASAVLRELRMLYQVLRDWYDDPRLRNGLGVLRASIRKEKGYAPERFRDLLRRLTGPPLEAGAPRAAVWAEIRSLPCLNQKRAASATPAAAPAEWQVSYGDDTEDIKDLFLLMSVFSAQARVSEPVAFNFVAYHQEKWSLEHIFPQNPAATFRELPAADQAELLELIEPTDREAVRGLLDLGPANRDEEDNERLSELLRAANQHLNGLGNLVLLDIKTNGTLRNHPFATKRQKLSEKVARGAFVPAHTFGVFAKLVPTSATDRLGVWGPQEMKQHHAYVLRERADLQQYFAQ